MKKVKKKTFVLPNHINVDQPKSCILDGVRPVTESITSLGSDQVAQGTWIASH